MGVAHGGQDTFVTRWLLNIADVSARFEEVGGKNMAQGVNAALLLNACIARAVEKVERTCVYSILWPPSALWGVGGLNTQLVAKLLELPHGLSPLRLIFALHSARSIIDHNLSAARSHQY